MNTPKSSNRPRIIPVILVLAVIALLAYAGWQYLHPAAASSGLTASGTIESRMVTLSAELSGRVTEVALDEGQQVQAGQVLVKLDDSSLQGQYQQAMANQQAAQANYDLLAAGATDEQLRQAQGTLDTAKANYELLKAGATDEQLRQAQAAVVAATANYSRTVEGARPASVAAAQASLSAATEAYNKVKAGPQQTDYAAAEAAYNNAQAALQQAQFAYDAAYKRNPAAIGASPQSMALQQATNNFTAAKAAYDKAAQSPDAAQTSAAYQQVQSARAALDQTANPARDFDVVQARAQVDQAQAALDALKAGTRQQQLDAAKAQVDTAQAVLDGLKAGARQQQLDAAKAQIAAAAATVKGLQVQLSKTSISSPVDGVILVRSIDPGEIAVPGAPLFQIGHLNQLEITVYLPEEQYALVKPGEKANVHVDAYPNRVFTAAVLRIASQAEFTPRNVQTIEGRTNTVFAVRLSIDNTDMALAPGMPADVTFTQN